MSVPSAAVTEVPWRGEDPSIVISSCSPFMTISKDSSKPDSRLSRAHRNQSHEQPRKSVVDQLTPELSAV